MWTITWRRTVTTRNRYERWSTKWRKRFKNDRNRRSKRRVMSPGVSINSCFCLSVRLAIVKVEPLDETTHAPADTSSKDEASQGVVWHRSESFSEDELLYIGFDRLQKWVRSSWFIRLILCFLLVWSSTPTITNEKVSLGALELVDENLFLVLVIESTTARIKSER